MKLGEFMIAKSKAERLANRVPSIKKQNGPMRIDLDYIE